MLGIATLAAGALAAGIAGVAAAADGSGSPSPSSTASPSTSPSPGTTTSPGTPAPDEKRADGDKGHRFGRHGPGGLGALGPLGRLGTGAPLHGEFVTPKADGGYQTVRTQRGEVTEVSSSSITIKSEDGFTATYPVTADTLVNAGRDGIAAVQKGDQAQVLAVKDGDKYTAQAIVDLSRLDWLRERFGWHKDREDRGGTATPTPAPSGSTRSSGLTAALGI
jgi:hypothetical protein